MTGSIFDVEVLISFQNLINKKKIVDNNACESESDNEKDDIVDYSDEEDLV